MAEMYERHIRPRLEEALIDTPASVLQGPRQAGKSTIAHASHDAGEVDGYFTFDDETLVEAALRDPAGFIGGLPRRVALDEVQRAPGLLTAIKRAIDEDRRSATSEPRRFLLTGSVDILASVSESLAGRVQIETLWPLSQGELVRVRERFLDRIFAPPLQGAAHPDGADLAEHVLRGGFPSVVERSSARRRDWLRSYVSALVQRDARDLAAIDRIHDLPRLLALVAARATGILNIADLSRASGLPQSTTRRYLNLLERLFLVVPIRAWHANLGQRLVKSEKLFLSDSALHASLIGASPATLRRDRGVLGPLLEGFVAMELLKQVSWSDGIGGLFHFRTARGEEVDFLVEDDAGRVAAVEVKASGTVRRDDFRAMDLLANELGTRFVSGVVLYGGDAAIPFSDRLAAWPIQELWSGRTGWKVVEGPIAIERPGLDARVWRWRLASDDETRDVDVQIAGTVLAVDPETLPVLAREAAETRGRAVVEQLARRATDPPAVVEVHTKLRSLPVV